AVVERVKVVVAVRAAQEIEADALAHAAERKAELLELAAGYEAEGRTEVAAELRAQVGRADADRPLAGVGHGGLPWGGGHPGPGRALAGAKRRPARARRAGD